MITFDGQNQESSVIKEESSFITPRTPRPDKHTKRSVQLGHEEDRRQLRKAIESKARAMISWVRASGEKLKVRKPTRRPQLEARQHVRLSSGRFIGHSK